jgi:mono/diheme cytochrome c family protein
MNCPISSNPASASVNASANASMQRSLGPQRFLSEPRAWLQWWTGMGLLLGLGWISDAARGDEQLEFFEKRIRPVLVEQCYSCHSAAAEELKGGLRLDLKAGWMAGGDAGEPAIVPGDPDASPLMRSLRHERSHAPMPPNQPRLPPAVLADLALWIERGAVDPRDEPWTRPAAVADWESEFQRRRQWWSLQPLVAPTPPAVLREVNWPRTPVDAFILARLEQAGLAPAPAATPRTLARRLSFALTGLPPEPAKTAAYLAEPSPENYAALVQALLDSPEFGQRWARHWMDVVHYADTHGYEWDVPAKHAWRYRDYLIRAFNRDVPFQRLILEQLAGDLLDPRIDPDTGVNEALIGPMALRLGERRHGDSSAVEGVSQEAVSNMIDTIGKGFLGTTLACAQCHDHKLDAVAQQDYYALAGILMSTRYSARTIDTHDPNTAVIEELRVIKQQLRTELARVWLETTRDSLPDTLRGLVGEPATGDTQPPPATELKPGEFPATLVELWKRIQTTPITAEQFEQERHARMAANQQHLQVIADFTRPDGAPGWRWDGWGMQHGLVADGELVVADEGERVLQHLLPAGRYSHIWSQRLAGSLQGPQLDPLEPVTFSIELVGGKSAAHVFIVDQALNSERIQFFSQPQLGWLKRTAGNFDSLEGSIDKVPRRVYFELATKSLNNYFPPRVGYSGAKEEEIADERSWIGVTRVVQHSVRETPRDELERYVRLFAGSKTWLTADAWAEGITLTLHAAIERWSRGECDRADVELLAEALEQQWLPNTRAMSPKVSQLVDAYRATEQRIQSDRTVGSAAEWWEGRDERLAIRGVYTELGDPVPRRQVRFLGEPLELENAAGSGRLELAQRIADPRHPLTARVYVNRVWHYLFGEGLVRTPDDFGHLGEPPVQPELLDYLAARFIAEGGSTKQLVRLLVTSAVWQQASVPAEAAVISDPENRLWHHMPLRRLEAEALRDAMLAVSGRLDPTLFGPPIKPYRTAEDSQKRLFRGPLDGDGRRSLYLEMTLMEPPRFLALFNQPLPKQTVGRRDVTNVPDQALALLNDPFVIAMAEHWSRRVLQDGALSVEQRLSQMLSSALGRPPELAEVESLAALARHCAQLRGSGEELLTQQPVWQDVAHAIFNMKEFLYVP